MNCATWKDTYQHCVSVLARLDPESVEDIRPCEMENSSPTLSVPSSHINYCWHIFHATLNLAAHQFKVLDSYSQSHSWQQKGGPINWGNTTGRKWYSVQSKITNDCSYTKTYWLSWNNKSKYWVLIYRNPQFHQKFGWRHYHEQTLRISILSPLSDVGLSGCWSAAVNTVTNCGRNGNKNFLATPYKRQINNVNFTPGTEDTLQSGNKKANSNSQYYTGMLQLRIQSTLHWD